METAVLYVRIPVDVKDRLAELATHTGTSLASVTSHVLSNALGLKSAAALIDAEMHRKGWHA